MLGNHSRRSYFDKEFFNPMCNGEIAGTLEKGFGCELSNTVSAISDWNSATQKAVDYWTDSPYGFTKEVWSVMKINALLTRGFHLFGLTRPADSVFPPTRMRVWQWYDQLYWALGREDADMPMKIRALAAFHECDMRIRGLKTVLDAEALYAGSIGVVRQQVEMVADMLQIDDVTACANEFMDTRNHPGVRKWIR